MEKKTAPFDEGECCRVQELMEKHIRFGLSFEEHARLTGHTKECGKCREMLAVARAIIDQQSFIFLC
jgi:hypothetical protein